MTLNTGRKNKQISSHQTEDGVNYHAPKCHKVAAKKTDGSGRRKQWSKDSSAFLLQGYFTSFFAELDQPQTNNNPFPTAPSTHRSEDSLNQESSRTTDLDFGFQQRMVRFDEEPPKPPSVSYFLLVRENVLKFSSLSANLHFDPSRTARFDDL